MLTALGVTQTMAQWADDLEIVESYVRHMARRHGRDGFEAFARRIIAKRQDAESIPAGHPGSLSWSKLAWEDDVHAQYAVECHPRGMTLDEIGELMGLTRQRVEQIEKEALRKVQRALARRGE
jgi:DnaJ-domain-containing protein 1